MKQNLIFAVYFTLRLQKLTTSVPGSGGRAQLSGVQHLLHVLGTAGKRAKDPVQTSARPAVVTVVVFVVQEMEVITTTSEIQRS